jgi:hypothetical protein
MHASTMLNKQVCAATSERALQDLADQAQQLGFGYYRRFLRLALSWCVSETADGAGELRYFFAKQGGVGGTPTIYAQSQS